MIKTLQHIYQKIKSIYNNNPSDLLFIISSTSFVLFLVLIMGMIEGSVFINQDEYSIQRIIFIIATQLFYTGMMIGIFKIIFKIIDSQNRKLSDVFNYFDILPNIVAASLLNYFILLLSLVPSFLFIYLKYGIEKLYIILEIFLSDDSTTQTLLEGYIGSTDFLIILLFLTLPLIYISIRTLFMNFYIIDLQYSPIESLRKSWAVTTNEKLNIFSYVMLFFLLNLFIGIISFGLGLLLSFPLSLFFLCQYYRILDNQYNNRSTNE